MPRQIALLSLLLTTAVLTAATPAAAQAPSRAIAAAVADASRPAADTARDADRKPAQVVAFSGLKPGDKIADLIPGGGYFTRIFAKVVGPKGHVYASVPQILSTRPGVMDGINAIAKDNANVTAAVVDFAKMDFPEKLDMVWTSENYHDFHNAPGVDVVAMNRLIYGALRPGGVYMVEDHSAPGAAIGSTSTLHRIDPAIVIQEVEAAGFKLEARSELLANPADPHTAAVFDPSIRGKTDKFLLKFRKPK